MKWLNSNIFYENDNSLLKGTKEYDIISLNNINVGKNKIYYKECNLYF
jgi:hypothetical protein